MHWRIMFLKEKILNSTDTFEFIMLIIGHTVFLCIIDFFLILIFGFFFIGKIETNINELKSIRDMVLVFSVPAIISYIILPTFILKKYNWKSELKGNIRQTGRNKVEIMIKTLASIFLIATIVYLFVRMKEQEAKIIFISFVFVAITEEYYIRGVVMNALRYKYKEWFAIIISSAIFVFILHSGGNIYINLFVRLPVSILISLAYIKSGDLYSSICLHLGYDLLVNTI